MKVSSIKEIKSELENHSSEELIAYCLRLSKLKKENKELLTYVLFEEKFPEAFIDNFKTEIDQLFAEINFSNLYYIRKGVRKILRYTSKYAKFVDSVPIAAEMLIHFCNNIVDFDIPISRSTQLMNMYSGQVKKIDSLLSTLHPDLQYDLGRQLRRI